MTFQKHVLSSSHVTRPTQSASFLHDWSEDVEALDAVLLADDGGKLIVEEAEDPDGGAGGGGATTGGTGGATTGVTGGATTGGARGGVTGGAFGGAENVSRTHLQPRHFFGYSQVHSGRAMPPSRAGEWSVLCISIWFVCGLKN